MASKSRIESNRWLRPRCGRIKGKVISIGAMNDIDCEGSKYKNYFKNADSYLTTDVEGNVDMLLDVRDMSIIPDESYNCVFCCGVLEHVDDFMKGVSEITRILNKGGTLMLGLPFRQPIHSLPHDYWRFTALAIVYMLKKDFNIKEIKELGTEEENFPVSYWTRAIKK